MRALRACTPGGAAVNGPVPGAQELPETLEGRVHPGSTRALQEVPRGIEGQCFHRDLPDAEATASAQAECSAEQGGRCIISARERCRIDTEREDIPGLQGLQLGRRRHEL